MRYTHYWSTKSEFTPEEWKKITGKAKRIVSAAKKKGISICGGYGSKGTQPEVDEGGVWLNGCGNDSFETFNLQRGKADFAFCKTAHKPYDEVVVSILAAVKKIAGRKFEPRSDGGPEAIKNTLAALRRTRRTKRGR
jgi:hypothetical protein